jgi:hypothetical protein
MSSDIPGVDDAEMRASVSARTTLARSTAADDEAVLARAREAIANSDRLLRRIEKHWPGTVSDDTHR